jgi:hypothetical protein
VILIAYDASADAQVVIEHAGGLTSGESAVVLTVWEPFVGTMTRVRVGGGMAMAEVDFEELDQRSKKLARQRAEDGVERGEAGRAGCELAHRENTAVMMRLFP